MSRAVAAALAPRHGRRRCCSAPASSTAATGSTRRSPSASPRTTSPTSRARCARTARRRSSTCCCTAGWRSSARARPPRGRCRCCSRCSRCRSRGGRAPPSFDRRAGALAAAGAAGCPFLTYYAQETRMYSLVAVLSVLACASFVLAFLHGRRRYVWPLGAVDRAPALHAQLGAVPRRRAWASRGCGCGATGRVGGRDGALLAAGVALLYAPWVPSLVFQAANTAAPWAQRPTAAVPARHPGQPVRLRRLGAAGARRRRRCCGAGGRPRRCACWR